MKRCWLSETLGGDNPSRVIGALCFRSVFVSSSPVFPALKEVIVEHVCFDSLLLSSMLPMESEPRGSATHVCVSTCRSLLE